MKKSVKSAGKFTALESPEQINAEIQGIQERIRRRAFEISTSRGHAGREMDDWLSAESEIISVPPVEVTEREGAYFVKVAVAGVNSSDLEVIAAGNQILIKGEFRHDHAENESRIHLCDFKSAVLFRKIDLPEPIDLKTIELEFRDGMLRITVYKEGVSASEGSRPAKTTTSPRSRAKAKG